MANTQVDLSSATIDKLRALARAAQANDEESELAAAVTELVDAAADDDPGHQAEYGFRVVLTGIARVTDTNRTAAARALCEFQDVDVVVPYGPVTVTQLSLVAEGATLVDIDGRPLIADL